MMLFEALLSLMLKGSSQGVEMMSFEALLFQRRWFGCWRGLFPLLGFGSWVHRQSQNPKRNMIITESNVGEPVLTTIKHPMCLSPLTTFPSTFPNVLINFPMSYEVSERMNTVE